MKRISGVAIQFLILALAAFAEKAPAPQTPPVPKNESGLTAILSTAVAARSGTTVEGSPEPAAQPPAPDSLPADPEPPKEISLSPAYARMDEHGAIITGTDEWYLEEPDEWGRPSSGIVWKGGKIARQISWLYYGDTVRVRAKIETDETRTVESDYDKDGNETSVAVMDAKGGVTDKTENVYGKNGKLSTSTVETVGKKTRTEYAYAKDGTLAQKKIFVNDALSRELSYTDENNWTEKVYKNDRVILVLAYENGARQDTK